MTLQDQLTNIQTAIFSLENKGVKSIKILGREVTYENLQVLYDRESQLMRRLSANGKITVQSLIA